MRLPPYRGSLRGLGWSRTNLDSPQAGRLEARWLAAGGTLLDSLGRFQSSASTEIALGHDPVLGQAGVFSSDYVNVPSHAALQPATLSIVAWVRPDSLTTDATIIKKNSSYILRQNASSGLNFYIWAGSFINLQVNSILTAGVPIHVAATYNGSSQVLYVNGINVGSAGNSGALATSANDVGLGAQPGGGEAWPGLISEVRFYSFALSAGEVWNTFAPETRFDLDAAA